MNTLIVTIIWLLLFRSAYSASQCYQCTHSQNDRDLDCANADLKHLQNCTDDNQAITDWSCSEHFNFTTTTLLTVSRECIPRIFTSGCTSTGNSYETFMTCVCDSDGCNDFILEIQNETTTTTTTTTVQSTITYEVTTTTTLQPTTIPDNGSVNLRFSSILVACQFLVFSLNRACQ